MTAKRLKEKADAFHTSEAKFERLLEWFNKESENGKYSIEAINPESYGIDMPILIDRLEALGFDVEYFRGDNMIASSIRISWK